MSRKKPYEPSPLVRSGRVGLAVMRLQPPTRGHLALLGHMLQDCDTVIVAFGSTQLSRRSSDPFTFEQRLEMLRAVYGDVFKPIQLVDIDAPATTDEWVNYVLDKARKMNLPEPTDYYTGSAQDAKWYTSHFARLEDPVQTIGWVTTYASPETGRRLHILDRRKIELPPATEIRSLIERRDEEWKLYVPARLVPFIEATYPPELRVALQGETPPEPDSVPVGTRFTRTGDPERRILVLRDDGVWRPERPDRAV